MDPPATSLFGSGDGYVDQFKNQFTVISFDARDHGKSDKPWDVSAYDLQLTAQDTIAVLDAEKIEKAHFWDYSMGGYTGFNLAAHFPKRLLSLIVGDGTAHSYHDQTEPAGDADEGACEYGQLATELMPDARFVSLPDLNYVSASVEVDQIMPAALSFLANLTTDG